MEKVEFIIVDKIVETLCVDANRVKVTNIELAVIGNVDGGVAVGFAEVVLGFMKYIVDVKISVAVVDLCCVINVDFLFWVVKKAVAVKRTGEEYLERVVNLNLVMELVTDVQLSENEVFIVVDFLVCVNSTGEEYSVMVVDMYFVLQLVDDSLLVVVCSVSVLVDNNVNAVFVDVDIFLFVDDKLSTVNRIGEE